MADIFLSYAREDLAKAQMLATALEELGWSVFWDRASILTGQDFDEVIEQAIAQASCMIVAWSNTSKKSDWVRGEASIGRERRILLPVLFELVKPPIAFRSLHTEDLSVWKGEAGAPALLALCKAVRQRLEPHQSESTDAIAKQTPPKQLGHKLSKIIGSLAVFAGVVAIGVYAPADKQSAENRVEVVADNTEPEPVIKPSDTTSLFAEAKPLIKQSETVALLVATEQGSDKTKLPEMLSLAAGEFWMGSANDDNNAGSDEKPRHKVTVKAFAIGAHEVSFEEYDQFVAATGVKLPDDSGWGRGKRPVINIGWDDATAYAAWLSKNTGKRYRLPTEAEWEYAARAGSSDDYFWGNADAKQYAWFLENSGGKTLPIDNSGIKVNAFGLYNMAGNVWEWVQDCYTKNYDKASKEGSTWEPKDCFRRVLRGGSWGNLQTYLRSADREWSRPDGRGSDIGFRLAQDLP